MEIYIGYEFQDESSGLFGGDVPGEWKNYRKIVNEYGRIFILYRFFGDYGKLRKYSLGKRLKEFLSDVLDRPIPGWYDTYAKHLSAVTTNGVDGINHVNEIDED